MKCPICEKDIVEDLGVCLPFRIVDFDDPENGFIVDNINPSIICSTCFDEVENCKGEKE